MGILLRHNICHLLDCRVIYLPWILANDHFCAHASPYNGSTYRQTSFEASKSHHVASFTDTRPHNTPVNFRCSDIDLSIPFVLLA